MADPDKVKQHLSARIYLGYILYIERNHPQVDLEAICHRCGVTLEHLRNQNNWVSVTFDLQFMTELRKEINNPNLEMDVGVVSVSRECIGPFYVLGEHVVTLSGLYSQIVSYGPRLNRVVKFEVLKHEGRKIHMRVTPDSTGLNEEEAYALKKSFPSIISSMKGYYSAFPKIKRLRNAVVDVVPFEDGSEFYIEYPVDNISFIQKMSAAAAGPALFSVLEFLGMSVPAAWAASATVMLFLTLIFLTRRSKGLEQLSEENKIQNQDLIAVNRSLQDSNSGLQRQVQVSVTSNKIANHLVGNGSRTEILQSIAKELAEGLNYDRVMILLINEDKKLSFSAGVLDDSEFSRGIRTELFDTELESNDPGKLGNIFRFKRSILIEDVETHKKNLSPDGRRLFDMSRSKTFLAVPIYTENETLGILIADNSLLDRKLTPEDLRNAETCALQVGSVIQRLNAEANAKASQKRVEALAHAASRFVPTDMIELLGCKSVTDVELGMAKEHELAIAFTDIRGFTSLAETMTPEETAGFLLNYYRHQGPSISKYHGMVDKLLGDGILALFIDPNDAFQAAISFQRDLAVYNQKNRSSTNRPSIKTGIGLHFEKLRVASVGFDDHLSVTVVASGVNYASRLDELNKKFGTDIICSGSFYSYLYEKERVRFIGNMQVRGNKVAHDIYEIIGHKSEDEIKLLKRVEPLLHRISDLLKSGDADAIISEIDLALQIHPSDPVLLSYKNQVLASIRENLSIDEQLKRSA